jgi:hypothetical protein
LATLAPSDEQRREHQGRLVADAPGGMLVDRVREVGEVEPLAAVGHHLGEVGGLTHRHAAPRDRHEPGGHLVVGHLAADVAADEGLQGGAVVGARRAAWPG